MIFISARGFAESTGLGIDAAYRRLEGLPYTRGRERNHACRVFWLVDVIPQLARREVKRNCVANLFANSHQFVRHFAAPDVAYPSVKRLEKVLTEEQAARLFCYRVQYTEGLTNRATSAAAFAFHERARAVIIYDSGILRAVMTGDESNLPDFNSDWSVSWSVVNGIFEKLHNKEAA